MPPQFCENKYKVSEIFYSVQGEGKYTGTAAVFVRLAGCSMGCEWCDSAYAQTPADYLTAAEILEKVQVFPAKTVIITGGEPTEQNLTPLLELLHKQGFEIHIETNGANDIDTSLIFCVTVSPKKYADANMLKKADVIKLVLDSKLTEKDIISYFKYINDKTTLYLQPEGNKQENIEKCLQIIKKYPRLKLSLQTHKMINIR